MFVSKHIGMMLLVLSIIVLLSLFIVVTKNPSVVREGFEQKIYRVKVFMQQGCGHCTRFKPHFEAFKNKLTAYFSSDDGKNCNSKVVFDYIDISSDNENQFNKYKVTGTPSVILTENDGTQVSIFNGYQMNCQGLADWVSSIITCIPREVCASV